ncbi:MAG: MBL fold metallo-hydrolase [Azospirillum sp.]|nr:MBL fold metallo-hydrolase [Azospirillum sp.]
MTALAALGEGFVPASDSLYFLPLGGAGEIGLNLSLYGHAGKWLMVDLGISFADDKMPGVDIIMADPAFITRRRRDLVGLVLTHAHEDHIGAVPHLWPELECPVFATPFTAAMVRSKLHEHGLAGRLKLTEVPLSGRFKVGPFDVELVGVTHSIPQSSMVVIRTAAGTVLHTGDWKLDPRPVVGPVTDEAVLARLGGENVVALIGDSTGAMVPGHSGSEGGLLDGLTSLFGRFKRRIAVTCFASNVARLHNIAAAAAVHDRRVALVGRSLWRINEAARANGYLTDLPDFLSEHEAGYLPRDKVVLVCTGSQGEERSALARVAADDHPQVVLESGDVVIYSSREIPGNERAIHQIQNRLVARGIEVVTADDALVHVSGHPARDELARLYQWVRPRAALPVHGEPRHQQAHAELARQCQVSQVVIPANGSVVRLAPGPAEAIGSVPSGRLAIDGKRVVPAGGGAIKNRRRVLANGGAVATVVLNGKGELVTGPQVSTFGLIDDDSDRDDLLDAIDAVREAVADLPRAARHDDAVVTNAVRAAVRRSFNRSHGRKPVTEVHLIRL